VIEDVKRQLSVLRAVLLIVLNGLNALTLAQAIQFLFVYSDDHFLLAVGHLVRIIVGVLLSILLTVVLLRTEKASAWFYVLFVFYSIDLIISNFYSSSTIVTVKFILRVADFGIGINFVGIVYVIVFSLYRKKLKQLEQHRKFG
jgi:hypothetical protein